MQRQTSEHSARRPAATRRILVVDDDALMVQSLCDVLELAGWDTHGVPSGEAAIAAVRDGSFDAVIMDVRMPGIDGVEAFRRIRALRPDLPVFLMTAHTSSAQVSQAARQGVQRVFSKPLDLAALFAALEYAGRDSESADGDGSSDAEEAPQ